MALPAANFSTGQALLVALISAAMYGVFLLIQTKTHQSLFVYEHEDDSDDDDPHHGKPSAHSSVWHAIWLIIHLIAVIAVTKMNASPLETLLDSMNALSPLLASGGSVDSVAGRFRCVKSSVEQPGSSAR